MKLIKRDQTTITGRSTMSDASQSVNPEDVNKLKLFTERQDAEARLHWSRNSYFLVVMSILFVAYGQKPVEDLFQLVRSKCLLQL